MPPELNNDATAAEIEEISSTLLGLDDIENMDFDSIEDAPGFVQPPDGIYKLMVFKADLNKYKVKPENQVPGEPTEKKRFRLFYEIMEIEEMDEAAEQKPKVGDKFSENFMVNEEGVKYWKSKAKAIMGRELGKVTVANVLKELGAGNYEFRAKVQNTENEGKAGTANAGKKFKNTNVRVIGKAGEVPGMEAGQGKPGEQSKEVAVE